MGNNEYNCNEDSNSWNKGKSDPKLRSLKSNWRSAFHRLTIPYSEILYRQDSYGSDETNPYFRELLTVHFSENGRNVWNEYIAYVNASTELLSYIVEAIPEFEVNSPFGKVLNMMRADTVKPNMLACMCHFSLMNSVCDYVTLHWLNSSFRYGWQLVRVADEKLGVGYRDYYKAAIRLFKLATTDITAIAKDEVFKWLRKLFGSINHSFNDPLVENQLLQGIPYACAAYGNKDGFSYHLRALPFQLPCGRNIRGRFSLPLNLHGFAAIGLNGEPVLAFRGTELGFNNIVTDIAQYLIGISFVYKMALGVALSFDRLYDSFEVYGHSLGGGLAQFAVAGLDNPNVKAYGYNSAGLSDIGYDILKNKVHDNIFHLHLPCDQVFFIGKQLGGYANMKDRVWHPVEAHKIEKMQEVAEYCYCVRNINVTVD